MAGLLGKAGSRKASKTQKGRDGSSMRRGNILEEDSAAWERGSRRENLGHGPGC